MAEVPVQKGKLRVAKYDWKSGVSPKTEGYTNILIHTQEELSPFVLKDSNGVIMENYWQFSKIYPKVLKIKQYVHGKSGPIRWEWPTELHFIRGVEDAAIQILPEYWKWRSAGFKNPKWVRYPNGFGNRKTVYGSVIETAVDNYEIVGYIEARKRIYLPKYRECAVVTGSFADLKKRYIAGEKLQIVEVDGPAYADYYPYNLVKNGSIEITEEILEALIDCDKQNFGHGYSLCACLMNVDFQ